MEKLITKTDIDTKNLISLVVVLNEEKNEYHVLQLEYDEETYRSEPFKSYEKTEELYNKMLDELYQ